MLFVTDHVLLPRLLFVSSFLLLATQATLPSLLLSLSSFHRVISSSRCNLLLVFGERHYSFATASPNCFRPRHCFALFCLELNKRNTSMSSPSPRDRARAYRRPDQFSLLLSSVSILFIPGEYLTGRRESAAVGRDFALRLEWKLVHSEPAICISV